MRHSTYLEVNLGHIGQNFEKIQELAPRAEIVPMVKSNAYGNGMIPIAQFLVRDCGVKKLGCGTLGEALRITEECPDMKADLIVYSDTELHDSELRQAYLNLNITPVLAQPRDLELVLKDPTFKRMPLIVKLNTGMNRLGFTWEELEPFVPRLKERGIEHLMTHFARSSEVLKPGDKTNRQMDEFNKIRTALQEAGVEIRGTSVSNSGAIEQKFGVEETFVRPGLMLYGPPSVTDPISWNGAQCSRLVTKVLFSFPVKKGVPVGYGVNVTPKDGYMVVVPIGYGDGLFTYASGTRLNVNGYEGYIFGRISMDVAYIFFDPEVATKIKLDDKIEIWNHDNRVITDIATQNKTIAYQLMCGISSRIPRIYKVK